MRAARVPTTTNARCIDFAYVRGSGRIPDEAAKERELIAYLRKMDVITADTCINYQTLYQPHQGERVAWGDTGTVIYANSVFGARSNFESGPAALAAAHHRARRGIRLSARRTPQGHVLVDVSRRELEDFADWGALGKLVGEAHQDYFAVPVFTGIKRTPTGRRVEASRLRRSRATARWACSTWSA